MARRDKFGVMSVKLRVLLGYHGGRIGRQCVATPVGAPWCLTREQRDEIRPPPAGVRKKSRPLPAAAPQCPVFYRPSAALRPNPRPGRHASYHRAATGSARGSERVPPPSTARPSRSNTVASRPQRPTAYSPAPNSGNHGYLRTARHKQHELLGQGRGTWIEDSGQRPGSGIDPPIPAGGVLLPNALEGRHLRPYQASATPAGQFSGREPVTTILGPAPYFRGSALARPTYPPLQ